MFLFRIIIENIWILNFILLKLDLVVAKIKHVTFLNLF